MVENSYFGFKNRLAAFVAVAAVIAVVSIGIYKYHENQVRIARGAKIVAMVNSTAIHERDLGALEPPASHDEALALMVDFTLLDQAAANAHITVPDSELTQERLALIQNTNTKSYADACKKIGRTSAGMDLQLKHALLLRKLADLKVGGNPSDMFHARGILIKVGGPHAATDTAALDYAQQLQSKIEHGTDIAALAKAYSDDNLSGPNGGDLGVISTAGAPNLVHQTLDFDMQLALSHQLGKAKVGLISGDPIKGEVGYWVLEVVSTQNDPRGEQDLYNHEISLYRSEWDMKFEPMVMMHLRSVAYIQPPLAQGVPGQQNMKTQ